MLLCADDSVQRIFKLSYTSTAYFRHEMPINQLGQALSLPYVFVYLKSFRHLTPYI
jgi:hypothetical protein